MTKFNILQRYCSLVCIPEIETTYQKTLHLKTYCSPPAKFESHIKKITVEYQIVRTGVLSQNIAISNYANIRVWQSTKLPQDESGVSGYFCRGRCVDNENGSM